MSEHPPTQTWRQLVDHLVDEHGQDRDRITWQPDEYTDVRLRRTAAEQLHHDLHAEAEAERLVAQDWGERWDQLPDPDQEPAQ